MNLRSYAAASEVDLIERARGRDRYTLHFTFTKDAHKRERNAKRKKALKAVNDWVRQKPSNCRVVFRGSKKTDLSLMIDLKEAFSG